MEAGSTESVLMLALTPPSCRGEHGACSSLMQRMFLVQHKPMTFRILKRFVLAGMVLVGAHLGNAQIPSTESKPNILFIAVDDLNDWVGFMKGHPGMTIHTPNLDRLAASFMFFTNAHTPAPACAPARSGAEKVFWGDGPRWREFEALREVETLEQFFKNRGYKTLGAGKIYHSQAPPWAPTSQVEPATWDFYYRI